MIKDEDRSDTKQNEKSRLETGLRQGKIFFGKIKTRELQRETKNLIHQSKISIHQKSHQLQSFSYQKAFRIRKEGIKLSFNLARRNVSRSKYRSTLLI